MRVKNFSAEDIKTRVSWINNSSINTSMYFDLPATIEQTQKWHESNKTKTNRQDFTFFKGNEIVAMGGLVSIDKQASHAELYIMVNPNLHGQGWGKKSTKWLLFYGFEYLKLNKVYLFTDGANVSGYRLYESIGMVYEGTMRQHKLKNGELKDRRIYSILSEEWELLNYAEDFKYEN